MARLWGVFINVCLSRDYVFSGFSALPIRLNGVAVTVQSRRRYGAIASPLRCNRDAVTVQSRRRYGAIAKLFGRKHADKAVASGFSALNGPVPKC